MRVCVLEFLTPFLALTFLTVACDRAPGSKDRFVDVAAACGVVFRCETGARGEKHLPETVTGAAGWIDFDQDGDCDLVLAGGHAHPDRGGPGEQHTARLFRNDSGKFTDATEEARLDFRGYGMGLAVGDVDNDGRDDLFVAAFSPSGEAGNALFHNDGGTFRDVTAEAGLASKGWATACAFFDYDGDGFLDLFVARYVRYDPSKHCTGFGGLRSHCGPTDYPGEADLLFHNRGGARFEEVSAASGIGVDDPAGGAGLGALAFDFDLDGDQDIFVANDNSPNYLWRNDGARFTDVALSAGVAYGPEGDARAGMGVDARDLNGDGLEDLVVTHCENESDALFLSQGVGLWRDAAREWGIAGPTLAPLGFGVLLEDFDLDGDADLYIAEGHVHDEIEKLRPGSGQTYAQRDLLLENTGGRFRDVSLASGPWFQVARVGRAAASCDFDGDGDIDIAVTNAQGDAALLENRSENRPWIALRLEGRKANRNAYGARVAVVVKDASEAEAVPHPTVRSSRSYNAACDPRVHFFFGARAPNMVRAVVQWPGPTHAVEEFSSLKLLATHRLVEGQGKAADPQVGALFQPRDGSATEEPPSLAPPGLAPADSKPRPAVLTEVLRLRRSHRLTEALALLEREITRDGALEADPHVRIERASLLLNFDRFDEANRELSALRDSKQLDQRGLTLYAQVRAGLGNHADAIASWLALEKSGQRLSGETLRSLARSLLAQGKAADALERLATALADDPWLDAAYLDLGHAYALLGRAALAKPFQVRYRALEPVRRKEDEVLRLEHEGRAAPAAHARGEAELLRGRLHRAMLAFNAALNADRAYGPAFLALARLSARLERQDDALRQLASQPAHPEVDTVRGEIQASLAVALDLDQKRAELRERIRTKPLGACVSELIELAQASKAAGDSPRSREIALFAAELDPRSVEAQRAAADVFDAPDETFVRWWALRRAAQIAPQDAAIATQIERLRRDLAR